MKKSLILCCILGLFYGGFAQIPYQKTFGVQIELGPSFVNLEDLNSILTRPDSNYLPFPEPIFSLGIGADYNSNRWMLGGSAEIYAFSAPGQRSDRIQLALLNYLYMRGRIGYVIYYGDMDNYPFLVYPSVGFGGGLSRLRTNISGGNLFNVNQGWGTLYDFALNLHWFPPIVTSETSCIKMGASIGYIYTPGKDWNMPNYNDGDALRVSPQGFYIKLIFGMAGGV